MRDAEVSYILDSSDLISDIQGDWDKFATDNDAAKFLVADVIQKPIFNFIENDRVQYVYKLLFTKVRTQKSSFTFPFRCDAPGARRFLQMTMAPADYDSVKIITNTLKIEPRAPLAILDNKVDRNDRYLLMCSVCKKVERGKNDWVEIEHALDNEKLFNQTAFPNISHGLCDSCYEKMNPE